MINKGDSSVLVQISALTLQGLAVLCIPSGTCSDTKPHSKAARN